MRKILPARGAKFSVVGTPCRKAQIPVRTTKNLICVIIVLAVVLPKAHGANFIPSPLDKRLESAARASKRKFTNMGHAV